MDLMKKSLDRIESLLQDIIERRLSTLLPLVEKDDEFFRSLILAIRSGIETHEDGRVYAPDYYVVFGSNSLNLDERQSISVELSNLVLEIGDNFGLYFFQQPQINISINPDLEPGSIDVIAGYRSKGVGETEEISRLMINERENKLQNSYLIINGSTTKLLHRYRINIGRHKDNDIVLQGQRISRFHALMRAVNDSYVIFDLDSTWGTFVNNQRITQKKLYPNDVITIAGVSMIFSQDEVPQEDTQQIYF
jgi:hypothetical protein